MAIKNLFDVVEPKEKGQISVPKVHNKYHNNVPASAVYVGRGSPYGNKFVIGKHGTRDQVIDMFIHKQLPGMDVRALKGKDLVCFCKPLRCHADYILKKANNLK